MSLLTIKDLRIWLPGAGMPVDGVSLKVDAGEVVGVAGESGSGKTLTALAILGLLPHGATTGGRIMFDGRDLLTLGGRQLQRVRGRQIAMIFQDPMTSLHPMLSIERQLTEHVQRHLDLGRREARERAVELLRQVRLPDPVGALEAFPHQFSGGMRQRIAIAIALACDPQVLIADEPTTALDVTVQAGILRLLDQLRQERGLSVIFITHDLGVMSALADRLYVFYAGRVAESGPTREVLPRPRHPYTQALLEALPHPEQRGGSGRTLVPIAGAPPNPLARPPGCAFHPRCRYAQDSCRAQQPALVTVDGGRQLACDVDPLVVRA